MAKNKPLVSVIIPMYNAARFIPQTLESLLYQTMQDFEVVVIDDCSTDNSVEVVESYVEKFRNGGVKLNVIKLPKNSGAPGLPRNVGIQFARGKYIAFLDSDDLFTKTALEELSTLAEESQADVVHTDGFFFLDEEKLTSATTEELLDTKDYIVIRCNPNSPRLDNPIYAPDNFAERMHLWLNSDFHWATCALFCNRNFFIANQIKFPDMPLAEDIIANFSCLCLAEKVLRVPNINYLYSQHEDSASHANADFEKSFRKWIKGLNIGFNELNKVMDKIPFFAEHADYRYAVLNWYFIKVIQQARQLQAAYSQVHPAALNQLVEREFHADDAAFSAYLFNTVNIQRLQIMQLQAELRKFQNL